MVNATLVVTSNAGLSSSITAIAHLDFTPPTLPTGGVVANGLTPVHVAYTSQAVYVSVYFNTFIDNESGVAQYFVTLQSTAAGLTSDVISNTVNASSFSGGAYQATYSLNGTGSAGSHLLQCSAVYRWAVYAVNVAGCSSATNYSRTFVFDNTPPDVHATPAVVDVVASTALAGPALSCTSNTSLVAVRFHGLFDACSSIRSYDIAMVPSTMLNVGSNPNVSWSSFLGTIQPSDTNQTVYTSNLGGFNSYPNGVYLLAVRATDQVNLTSVATSAPFIFDATPPVFTGPVLDDPWQTYNQTNATSSNRPCVAFSVSDPVAGLASLNLSVISIANGSTLLTVPVNLTLAQGSSLKVAPTWYCVPTPLALVQLSSYRVLLTAASACTGLVSSASSVGFQYDASTPNVSAVLDGCSGPDAAIQQQSSVMSVRWAATTRVNPIANSTVAFFNCAAPSVALYASAALAPSVSSLSVPYSLTNGVQICANVTVTDKQGLTTVGHTNGVVVATSGMHSVQCLYCAR